MWIDRSKYEKLAHDSKLAAELRLDNESLREDLSDLRTRMPARHLVTVTHEFKPKPRPNQLTLIVRNHDGQEFRVAPIQLYGQRLSPISFPLVWVTGNYGEHNGVTVNLTGEFYYEVGTGQ